MEQPKPRPQRFYGYPRPVEAPYIPFTKSDNANPVFRGLLLAVGAWLVSKLGFVQKFLWTNAGFDGLRKLKHLKAYTERWDPTVIPLVDPESTAELSKLDSESFPMLPENLPGRYHSVSEYHALFLSGQLTPLAVAESLIPLILRNPKGRHSTAFIETHVDAVIEAAKASTLRYQQGTPLSILDGVPTTIKDESDVKGYRTTQGRKVNTDLMPIAEKSSWPVQKWEEAGAVILGKANMHELGADTTNNNPNWGTPRNPHNEQYYTGGSSGGPAYIVSAGLCPIVLGSDGGGSIRLPSSYCGVYGLKPSHNRLEDTESTVTVLGPLAATVADLEIAYRLAAAPNPDDPTCALFAPPGSNTRSYPKVLGIYKEWFDRADPPVKELCNSVISYCKDKLGYQVVDINIPYVTEGQLAESFTILTEMAVRAQSHVKNPKDWLKDLNPANKVLLAVGAQTPGVDYFLAQQLRNMLMQHLAFLYQKYPGLIIVTPTTPNAGWPIASEGDLKYGISDGNMTIRNMEYVWMANLCGNPAISCPIGYVDPVKGERRVPIGIMGMGEWGSEDLLLGWGRECEGYLNEVYPGGRQRPGNWEDVVSIAGAKMGQGSK
ncbi:amidase signature enzyme [Hyaloscypha variabilis]